MITILLIILGVIGIYGLVYLGTVATVYLMQGLYNTAFDTSFDYNVWALGGLVFIVWVVIKDLIKS